jgi:hypothetical protein
MGTVVRIVRQDGGRCQAHLTSAGIYGLRHVQGQQKAERSTGDAFCRPLKLLVGCVMHCRKPLIYRRASILINRLSALNGCYTIVLSQLGTCGVPRIVFVQAQKRDLCLPASSMQRAFVGFLFLQQDLFVLFGAKLVGLFQGLPFCARWPRKGNAHRDAVGILPYLHGPSIGTSGQYQSRNHNNQQSHLEPPWCAHCFEKSRQALSQWAFSELFQF